MIQRQIGLLNKQRYIYIYTSSNNCETDLFSDHSRCYKRNSRKNTECISFNYYDLLIEMDD